MAPFKLTIDCIEILFKSVKRDKLNNLRKNISQINRLAIISIATFLLSIITGIITEYRMP